MNRFLVLPRDPQGAWDDVSPAEMQRIVEKYVAWGDGLRSAGKMETGEKLRDGEGKVLRGEGEALAVSDGPFAEAKEVVGGFWILRARDLDEAAALVSDCPHLAFGSLELRAIESGEAPPA